MTPAFVARPRKPFRATRLPLLARCYRDAFRSGHAQPINPMRRFARRLAFYFILRATWGRQEGGLALELPEGVRHASFNARNRQFNALYFDKYAFAYEPEVSVLIDHCVPDGGIFYDVGANWGYFSFYLAARPGFRGTIHSFEPWPPTFHDLQALVQTWGLSDRIQLHACALGAEPGQVGMHVGTHSGLARVANGSTGPQVKMQTLDSLDLSPPDLLKLDVEGQEHAVLSGGRRLLATGCPAIIMEDRLGHEPTDALELLEHVGYQLTIPYLVCRHRATGREHKAAGYFDSATSEYVRVECQPFRAADRSGHGPAVNIFAYHPSRLPALAMNHV